MKSFVLNLSIFENSFKTGKYKRSHKKLSTIFKNVIPMYIINLISDGFY